jgi:hypothetical protein
VVTGGTLLAAIQDRSIQLAVTVLLVGLLGFPANTRAQGACAGADPAKCTPEICQVLEGNKVGICNVAESLGSCTGVFGCENLTARRDAWRNCMHARVSVTYGCFTPPHAGHVTQIESAAGAVAKCERKMMLLEPEGCEKRCPWE